MAQWPDIRFERSVVYIERSHFVTQYQMSATTPDGRQIVCDGADVFAVADGFVRRKDTYLDWAVNTTAARRGRGLRRPRSEAPYGGRPQAVIRPRPPFRRFDRNLWRSVESSLQQRPRKREAQMHALVTRVTIHNADATREALNTSCAGVSGATPVFKTGYWTWPTGGAASNGLAMMIFDSEENATRGRRADTRVANARPGRHLDSVEVREVVASA
jgi:hypothetical protein